MHFINRIHKKHDNIRLINLKEIYLALVRLNINKLLIIISTVLLSIEKFYNV